MTAGRTAYLSGLAAEEIAARLYEAEGGRVLARRWRSPEGEIDLVVALGAVTVFVEVKARRDGARAAHSLRPAQVRRIGAAVARYLAEAGDAAGEVRVDVVLVDRGGTAERIVNAVSFDGW